MSPFWLRLSEGFLEEKGADAGLEATEKTSVPKLGAKFPKKDC